MRRDFKKRSLRHRKKKAEDKDERMDSLQSRPPLAEEINDRKQVAESKREPAAPIEPEEHVREETCQIHVDAQEKPEGIQAGQGPTEEHILAVSFEEPKAKPPEEAETRLEEVVEAVHLEPIAFGEKKAKKRDWGWGPPDWLYKMSAAVSAVGLTSTAYIITKIMPVIKESGLASIDISLLGAMVIGGAGSCLMCVYFIAETISNIRQAIARRNWKRERIIRRFRRSQGTFSNPFGDLVNDEGELIDLS